MSRRGMGAAVLLWAGGVWCAYQTGLTVEAIPADASARDAAYQVMGAVYASAALIVLALGGDE